MKRSIQDEGLHPAGSDESWQESAVCSWRDCKAGIGATLHMGCELNRGISNVTIGVHSDEGMRFRFDADDLPLEKVSQGHGLKSGPLTIVHDGEQLRAIVDTPECQVNLRIIDMSDDFSSPVDDDDEFRQQVASNHFNVECRVEGYVVLGDKRYDINGLGHRDHSWGPRTFSAGNSVVSYRWLAGGVADKLTFSLYSLVTAQGVFGRHGWVRIGDTKHNVSHQTTVFMLEDGLSAEGAKAVCTLANGDTLIINYTVRGDALMTVRELHNVMSVGDIALDDGSRGYATLEYIECASQGVQAPVYSLGVAIENGLQKQPESRRR